MPKHRLLLLIVVAALLLFTFTLPSTLASPPSQGKGPGRAGIQSIPTVDIQNSYLQALSSEGGRFVIGTTGGDPSTPDDDNKRLLFGYPNNVGSSFSTLRIINDGATTDYRLGDTNWDTTGVAPVATPTSDGTTLTTVWEIDGIRVEERLYFSHPGTGWGTPNSTVIEYRISNNNASSRDVGLRIMLDTMIGDNDGAPFFVPGEGRLTQERDFRGNNVPDFWVAWEASDFAPDSLKAKGLLSGGGITVPDRLIVAHWDETLCSGAGPGLFSNSWDFTVNPNTAITCDSAVALYYNTLILEPGETRTIQTYNGLAGATDGLDLAADVASLVDASRQQIQDISQAADNVSTVGDYFLDKLDSDRVQRTVNLGLNGFSLLSQGVKWSLVGRGLDHIATPGYQAALHASWRGWTNDTVAKHWYKPLYDAVHNNRKLLFKATSEAFLEYVKEEGPIELADSPIGDWFINVLVPGPDTPFRDYLGNPAMQLGDGYRSELLREQDDLLALLAIQSLAPDQIAAYRADMLARQQANAHILAQVESYKNLLWDSYQKALADESNWWKFFGSLLIKYGIIGAATIAWDGPGFYIASTGLATFDTIYEYVQDTRALKHDEKMLDQSNRFLYGQVSLAYEQVALNTVAAFNLIRAGDPPQIASGDVSLAARKSFGHYRLWPQLWWAEESSQVELSIANTEAFSTTYQTSATYDHSGFWIGTERLSVQGQSLDLAGNSPGTAVIKFKSEQGGESPDEDSTVDILVLGATETGIYPVVNLPAVWDPERIEETIMTRAQAPAGYTTTQANEAPTYPYPLSSVVTILPESMDYQVTIGVINPFTLTVSATVTQTIPANFDLLDTGGAQIVNNDLVWNYTIEPGAGLELRALLRWEGMPGETALVPGAVLTFQDPDTGLGDAYTVPDETVPAAWPLAMSYDMTLTWETGTTITIPFTLTNVSTSFTTQGVFSSTVTTIDGMPLWSTTQPINISAGEIQPLSLLVQVPNTIGYAVFSGEIVLGTERRVIFEEIVDIQGAEKIYMPIIVK